MQTETQFGEVITFYSYKGGTGRTMALANVGCALAQTLGDDADGKRDAQPKNKVLLIDWDLEAPGLHHFLPPSDGAGQDGLLEFFTELAKETPQVRSRDDALDLLERVPFESYVRSTAVAGLDLLPAGRFDPSYGARVNRFSWEKFFTAAPTLLPTFAEVLATRYQFVLVDSRTGITDVSGICTTILPSKLVVVFTPNKQSLTGIFDLIRRATRYRRESNDWRPLSIFPLPSRIEPALAELMNEWRNGTDGRPGYQQQFESLFRDVYALDECDLTEYLNEVQIQHVPDYAYGEQVAVLTETATRLSLKRSYEEFATRLRTVDNAWEEVAVAHAARDIARHLRDVSVAVERGAFVEAWRMLRSDVDLYVANEKLSVPELPEMLATVANGLLKEGKFVEAQDMAVAAAAVQARESGPEATETLSRLLAWAQLLAANGQFQKALEVALKTRDSADSTNSPVGMEALQLIADLRTILGDVDRSLSAHRRALDAAAERFGEESDQFANSLLSLASAQATARRYDEAKQSLFRVLGIYERQGASEKIASVLRQMSAVDAAVGDLDSAEELLQQALTILRKIAADAAEIADILEQSAEIAEQRGDLPRARKLLEEAYFRRSTTRDRTDPAVINTLSEIGRLAARGGDFETAEERLMAALSIAENLPSEHALHSVLRRRLAVVLDQIDRSDEAENLLRAALKFAQAAENRKESVLVMLQLGRVLAARGNKRAADLFREAVALAQTLGDSHITAFALTYLGGYLANRGELAEAREEYKRALSLYQEIGDRNAEGIVSRTLATLDSELEHS